MVKQRNKSQKENEANAVVPAWLHAVALFVILFLGALTYSNSYDCSFHFDDKPNIINNSHIRKIDFNEPHYSLSNSRLMGSISFALNYKYSELNVRGYHLFNVMIHLLNACLVYGLVLLLFMTPELKTHSSFRHRFWLALFIALLFVAHPLATQSVTYIVQRLAALVTLFYLSSLFFYLKVRLSPTWNTTRIIYSLLTLLFAACAFLTKENSYTLPLAILLTELFFFQPKVFSFGGKNYRLIIALGVLATTLVLAVSRFSLDVLQPIPPSYGHAYTLTPETYLYTQFSVIVKYMQLLLVPVNLNLDYDFPLSYSLFELRPLLSLGLLIALLIVAIRLFKNHRMASFGIFWFFLTLSIESSIVPISDVIFEHRTYLPSFGFLLAVFWLGYSFVWRKNATVAITITVLLILTFSSMAYNRNKVWLNEYTLNKDIVSKSPQKSRANSNMALAYVERNKLDSALYYFDKAIALNNSYYDAHNNRGITLTRLNRIEEAMRDFSKCIELDSLKPKAYCNRANCRGTLGDYEVAISDYTKALSMDAQFFDALKNRGVTYLNMGKYYSAIDDFKKALTLDPRSEETRKLLEMAEQKAAVVKNAKLNQ